jgi:hypothetical protein
LHQQSLGVLEACRAVDDFEAASLKFAAFKSFDFVAHIGDAQLDGAPDEARLFDMNAELFGALDGIERRAPI